jgi:hypothetical protein
MTAESRTALTHQCHQSLEDTDYEKLHSNGSSSGEESLDAWTALTNIICRNKCDFYQGANGSLVLQPLVEAHCAIVVQRCIEQCQHRKT